MKFKYVNLEMSALIIGEGSPDRFGLEIGVSEVCD